MPDRMAFDVDLHTPIDTTHLYLRRSILDEVASGLHRGDPADIDLRFRMAVLDPILGVLCHAVREALDEDPKISTLYVDHLMRAIAAHLIKTHSDADKRGKCAPLKVGLTAHQLGRVREMIESRFAERLTLQDFSTELGMSADHFGRLFKRASGVPVHQFLLRSRIDRVRSFLAETTTPIADIARECGFTDQMHLTRAFRRIVGTTPAVFRKASQGISSS
jgi:AraC family transcriptional regulator